jgi:hypothetical protein
LAAAKVWATVSIRTRERPQARLKSLIRKTQPYAKKIAHRGVWAELSLVAEIDF